MAENPMEQLATLMEKLGEVAAEKGLTLEGFAAIPSKPGGPHLIQAIFGLNPEVAFTSQEERDMEQQFKEIALRERIQAHEDDVERIRRESIQKLADIEGLGAKKGIGLDEEEEPPPPPPPSDTPEAIIPDPEPVEKSIDEMSIDEMLAQMNKLDGEGENGQPV